MEIFSQIFFFFLLFLWEVPKGRSKSLPKGEIDSQTILSKGPVFDEHKIIKTNTFRLRCGVWGGRQALGGHVLRREKAILRTPAMNLQLRAVELRRRNTGVRRKWFRKTENPPYSLSRNSTYVQCASKSPWLQIA